MKAEEKKTEEREEKRRREREAGGEGGGFSSRYPPPSPRLPEAGGSKLFHSVTRNFTKFAPGASSHCKTWLRT